jgi:hypothetical protein
MNRGKNILQVQYGFDKKLMETCVLLKKYPSSQKEALVSRLQQVEKQYGLEYALLILYRQQVESGFVLADPLENHGKDVKNIFDDKTGITFMAQWNPHRELRKQHNLLIQRGIINDKSEKHHLVNIDKQGRACYLCYENIRQQNPAEVIYPVELSGETFYLGANFAYITNNHFTLFNKQHIPQKYRKAILKMMMEFTDKTHGVFKVIFNGLAGASIEHHEHMQVTTAMFPVENIHFDNNDIVTQQQGVKIIRPFYYTSLWLLEGENSAALIEYGHDIIHKWHAADEQNNTENIVVVKRDNDFRMFIFPRDRRKLAGKGKKGAMASFETSGNIVLSDEETERETYNTFSRKTVENLLASINPS